MIKAGHVFKKNKLGLTSLNIVFLTGYVYVKTGSSRILHLIENWISKRVGIYL